MNKTVFLLVGGDSDYSAMHFEQNFNTEVVYKEMVSNQAVEATITFEDEYNEEEINIKIYEFEEIDPKFIEFIRNNLIDYDSSKSKDIFEVKI